MSERVIDSRLANFLVALDWAWLAFVRAEAAYERDGSGASYRAVVRTEKELRAAALRVAVCPELGHGDQPLLGCQLHREDAEQVVREQGEM